MTERSLVRAHTGPCLYLLTLVLFILGQTACLPAYDPDEASFNGSGGGGNDNNGGGTNNGTTAPGTNNGTGGGGDCTAPAQEVCDGADNDCDGEIDEDFPRRGVLCGNNIGICHAVYICEGGAETCFASQDPEDEACDGLDNDCDGLVDELTANDPNNCGACGNTCAFENGMAACERGSCQLMACNPGFEDCDNDPGNGCETDTSSDPINCGGCGQICADETAQTMCQAGTCSIQACLGGRMDCNSFAGDGCEADLEVDIFNCGGCTNRCNFPSAQALCLDRACTFEGCNPGFADRDLLPDNGCEIGLRIVGSPPDSSLGNLTATSDRLFGSAGNRLYGYQLMPDGAIGSLLFTHTTSSNILHLDAEGAQVFAALESGDVQILSVANPDDITVTGLAVTSGPGPGFDRQSQHLYVADGRDGLKIFDISSPESTRLVGRAPAPEIVSSAHVFGTRTILSDARRASLDLYDTSDPTQPTHLGTLSLEASFDRAVLRGDLLITSFTGRNQIYLYRLSEDNQLSFLGQAELAGPIVGMEENSPFLIAVSQGSSNQTNVTLLDIRRPQRPAVVSSFDSPVTNRPRSAAVTDTQIYVAGEQGLQRFDINDIHNPASAQDLVRPTALRDLVLSNSMMFVAADGAVEVLDITNAPSPRRVARFGQGIFNLAVTQDSLFTTSDGEFNVSRYALNSLGLPDPQPNATFTGFRPTVIEASRDNRYVYAIQGTTLHIVDMGIPEGGQIVGSMNLDNTCRDIIRHEMILMMACNTGIVVVNAGDPANPQLLSLLPGENLYDLDLFGQTLYALADNAVSVYAVLQPGNLNFRGTAVFETTNMRHITGLNTWMVASAGSNLVLLDRSNLTNPQQVVTLPLDGGVVGLGNFGNFIYAGTNQGVFRLDVEAP